VTEAIPRGVDWDVMRIVSSDRFSVPSPSTVREEWTLEDVADAHALLDMYERLESKAAAKARAAANAAAQK